MPTGDILRATIVGTFCGEPVNVGLGFISNSGLETWAEESQALATSVIDTLGLIPAGGAYLAPLSVQYKVNNVRIQDLNPGLGAGLEYNVGNVGGNTTDDAMPPNDSLCVTWKTGLKGVANRGRSYLTGFAEDSANGGYWIEEIQAWANDDFAGALLAAYGPEGTGNYTLAVVHTMAGGSPVVPPTATPIVSAVIHNEVRTLRRRAVGVRISRRSSTP